MKNHTNEFELGKYNNNELTFDYQLPQVIHKKN